VKEQRKQRKFAQEDKRDAAGHCANVITTNESDGKTARRANLSAGHDQQGLTAARTPSHCLFCPSSYSYHHRLQVYHCHQMTYLPKMDYAAVQQSLVVQQRDHRKMVGLLAETMWLRLGRLRPKRRCMAGNGPVARGRRARPCPVDDRVSQTGMSATVAVVAVVTVAHAAVTGAGNQLEVVGGTSL
jgi:hypothetical protein